jgi:hypothetical protein
MPDGTNLPVVEVQEALIVFIKKAEHVCPIWSLRWKIQWNIRQSWKRTFDGWFR